MRRNGCSSKTNEMALTAFGHELLQIFVYNKLSLFVKKDIIDRRAIENIVVQLRWFILHNKLDMRQCKNFNYDKCLTQLWSLKKTKTT